MGPEVPVVSIDDAIWTQHGYYLEHKVAPQLKRLGSVAEEEAIPMLSFLALLVLKYKY
jgi:hypothetical protein